MFGAKNTQKSDYCMGVKVENVATGSSVQNPIIMKFSFDGDGVNPVNGGNEGSNKKKIEALADKILGDYVKSSNYEDNDPEISNLRVRQGHGGRNIYANRYADTSKRFRGFFHLMSQWSGSAFKLIWHDLLAFMLLYSIMALLYRYVLVEDPFVKECFEVWCVFCSRFKTMIPVTFLTGFYVSEVVRRYWDQYLALPYPDRLALKLVSFVPGRDDFRRNLRRTVMRYVNLSIVLVFRLVSSKVKARFPDYDSLVHAKLILPSEVDRIKNAEAQTPHEATWTPVLWALKLLERARTEKKITVEAPIFASLVSSFEYIEISNRKILNYGWVNFPLAYTQVATLSVFAYLFASLFGSQFLDPSDSSLLNLSAFPALNITFATTDPFKAHTPDMKIPFFTIIEFISYIGWIKVAETLLNPFGEDDEDFQINYLIDRNVQVSYMIVDDADVEFEMANDPFLEAGIAIPAELPYKDDSQREAAARDVVGPNEDDGLVNKIRKMSNVVIPGRKPSIKRKSLRRNISVLSGRETIPEGRESVDSTAEEESTARINGEIINVENEVNKL